MTDFNVINRSTGKKEKISLDQGVENAILQIFKSQSPVRTGTLKGQVRLEKTDNGFNIVSDIYYMPFTEERWISNRWRGRANPNEGWFKEAFEMSMRFISSVYGKEFTREP